MAQYQWDDDSASTDSYGWVPQRMYEPQQASGSRRAPLAGLLLSGVAIATLTKIAYQTESIGRDGVLHVFQKPWFLVLVMFAGMALCLPVAFVLYLIRCVRPKQLRRAHSSRVLDLTMFDPLIDADEIYPASVAPSLVQAWTYISVERQLLHLMLPALFDLAGSALLNAGLVFVSASATQMLRQSLLLFATAMAVVVYGKPLNRYHFLGLFGSLVGLSMVAAASIISGFGGRWDADTATHHTAGDSLMTPGAAAAAALAAAGLSAADPTAAAATALSLSRHHGRGGVPATAVGPSSWSKRWVVEGPHEMLVGIGLVVASQALHALQLAVDRERQWQEQRARRLSPLGVVGCEGLIGAVITACVVLPLVAHGPGAEGFGLREDTVDSFLCILNSTTLQIVLVAQLVAMQLYNGCMILVSGDLDMTRTTLLQAVRTLFVWFANLALHAIGPPHLGEPLETWSAIQAAGFAIAVIGAIIYARGDDERTRMSLQLEAALIMLDQPPPGSTIAGSMRSYFIGGGYSYAGGQAIQTPSAPVAAHADFDVGSIGRSMLRGTPAGSARAAGSIGSGATPMTTPPRLLSFRAAMQGDPFFGDIVGGSGSDASPPRLPVTRGAQGSVGSAPVGGLSPPGGSRMVPGGRRSGGGGAAGLSGSIP